MLKSVYAKSDDIPEGERQHYKKIGDRYVLELDGEHPVQAQNTILAQEKKDEVHKISQRAATAEAEVTKLQQAAANQPTLPSGHVAVPADEAKLLDAVKELGKPEELKRKLEERDTFETENTTLKKAQLLQQIADEENPKLKFSVLRDLDQRDGGLQYEKRDVTVDGKTNQVWHVKRDNKWVPLGAYKDERWTDYKGALETTEQKSGTPIPGQKADDKGQKPNLYSRIRQEAAERQKKEQEVNIPLEKRLNLVA